MKIALLLSFLIAFTGCKAGGGKTVSQGARSPASAAQNLPFKWDNFPLRVSISNDFVFDNTNPNPIDHMKRVWDNAVPDTTFFTYTSSQTDSKNTDSLASYEDGVIGIYISNSWFPELSRDALAITQFFAVKKTSSTGEYYSMRHADIIVNEDFYSFSYDENDQSNYDMSTVLLHELGHLLGLKHQKTRSIKAVMQPYLSASESNRTLYGDDKEKITAKYSTSSGAVAERLSAASYLPSGIPDGHKLHGIIELRANGECKHFYNGELKLTHFSF